MVNGILISEGIAWTLNSFLNFLFSLTDDHNTGGSGLAPWPARLTSPPPRLADFGYSNDMWEKDTVNIGLIC